MGNLTDHFAGGAGESNILEHLVWHPKGQTISTSKGDFTAGNITTHQDFTVSTMTTVNGTEIPYTPPDGTTKVYLRFEFLSRSPSSGAQLGSVSIEIERPGYGFIDVWDSRTQWFHNQSTYEVNRKSVECVIDINGTEDREQGSVSSWDVQRIIKVKAAAYGSSHPHRMHRTDYWRNAGTDSFVRPTMTIIAMK
jgi:hypothetical protein